MKSALDLQVLPLSTSSKEELYRLVDRVIEVIEEAGVKYTVNPFSTTIEGELEQIWEVAYKAHKKVLEADTGHNVISYIKLASGKDMGSTDEKLSRHRVE